MLKIGLTGGIASGKSTVARLFESHGVALIYADRIAREVVAVGSDGLAAVSETFGTEVISPSGELDRQALRVLIFSDDAKRKTLESILHPLILERSNALEAQARDASAPYVIFEIPLLIETGRDADMHRVLVVDVLESTQVARVMARDKCSEQQAQDILTAQSSRDTRLASADDVISNEGTLEDLEQQVEKLHQQYMELAQQV